MLSMEGSGYTLQASSVGVSSATAGPFTVGPEGATQLAVTIEPPSFVTAGNAFGVVVQAEDGFGNFVPSFTGGVTLALANPSDPAASLGGTLTVTADAGVAMFASVVLDQANDGETLQASSGNLGAATTTPITVGRGCHAPGDHQPASRQRHCRRRLRLDRRRPRSVREPRSQLHGQRDTSHWRTTLPETRSAAR